MSIIAAIKQAFNTTEDPAIMLEIEIYNRQFEIN
jgi:hypothetical protein